jgi:hypothetical protein
MEGVCLRHLRRDIRWRLPRNLWARQLRKTGEVKMESADANPFTRENLPEDVLNEWQHLPGIVFPAKEKEKLSAS